MSNFLKENLLMVVEKAIEFCMSIPVEDNHGKDFLVTEDVVSTWSNQ